MIRKLSHKNSVFKHNLDFNSSAMNDYEED